MAAERVIPTRRLRALVLGGGLAVAAILQVLDANPAVSQTTSLQAFKVARGPDLDPRASVWRRAPEIELALTAQAVTYPFGGGGVPSVRVRAMHDGSSLYVRVAWQDDTEDMSTVAAEDFADAVAVQFPAIAAATAPAICMGQADAGVNIWHWRADAERPLPMAADELHPDGYVDLYQATDDLYFPAREAGNPIAQRAGGPVQDLVAVGFGSLGPAPDRAVAGAGDWDGVEWAVVFARQFDVVDDQRPTFAVGTTTDVAVAAWNGATDDRNGQKAISPFLQLSISAADLPPAQKTDLQVLGIVGITAAALLALVFGLVSLLEPRRPA